MRVQKKNIKNILFLSLVVLIQAIIRPLSANAQNSWTGPRNVVWESKLKDRIGFLADSLCQGRATGTLGGVEASFHIMRIFDKASLTPFDGNYARHVWAGGGLVGHNIMAMIPGERKHTDKPSRYVIIGSHYDGLGNINGTFYPGADANASGVIAMTSLAEMIKARKDLGWSYPYSFIFVAFDAFKQDRAGSKALWQEIETGQLKDPYTGEIIGPEKIALMVNIDQIGSSLTPVSPERKDYMVVLGNDSINPSRRNRLNQCNRFFDIGLELCFDYYGSRNFTEIFYKLSDQKVFIEHNIPSVLFTSGITMNTNRTWDKTESLDLTILKKRIWLIFHWLENVL